MKAIETAYAGCRFRSRLEARWAVFFDELGIEWQYEPEGFIVGQCSCPPDSDDLWPDPCNGSCSTRFWYLPDFYLPRIGVWVEVKGRPTKADVLKSCLASLDDRGGLPLDPGGTAPDDSTRNALRLILLSNVPRPSKGWIVVHGGFRFHKGCVYMVPIFFQRGDAYELGEEWHIWCDGDPAELDGAWPMYLDRIYGTNPQGFMPDKWRSYQSAPVNAAYAAARSARFEHGERESWAS